MTTAKTRQQITQEAFDGDVMTRGLETPLDGAAARLDEQVDAFDGLAQTNRQTRDFQAGTTLRTETLDALDGCAQTNPQTQAWHSGMPDRRRVLDALDGRADRRDRALREIAKSEPERRRLPTPFDAPSPSPYNS